MHSFRSDNNAGLCPEARQALIEASDGTHRVGYGDDEYTQRAVDSFRAIFGKDIEVFFVATGTAANILAIASLTDPWEQVLCHDGSHFNEDESTGPERITHCRTVQIHTQPGVSTIRTNDLARYTRQSRGDVHQPQPGVLTVSNSTEMGEVYTPTQMRDLCQTAHEMGYRVHVDGARFANAVASGDFDPNELTGAAGVDALSFGGTKNGLASSEAVIFFPQDDGAAFQRAVRAFPYHRKATGHLLSKHRFLSAQFIATLQDGIWLKYAQHANTMAQQLAEGLRSVGVEIAYPVQANAVFVKMPEQLHEALHSAGHGYYSVQRAEGELHRYMTSHDTTAEDIEIFLADVRRFQIR